MVSTKTLEMKMLLLVAQVLEDITFESGNYFGVSKSDSYFVLIINSQVSRDSRFTYQF